MPFTLGSVFFSSLQGWERESVPKGVGIKTEERTQCSEVTGLILPFPDPVIHSKLLGIEDEKQSYK